MAFQDHMDAAHEVVPADDVADAIGLDERRMHVRAYNYWCSLLDGRDFPSIEDVEPAQVDDFAAHSVLLDFSMGGDNPATPYVGDAIVEECGATGKIKHGVAGKRHRLISHNAKYIRQNRGTSVLSEADSKTVKKWAPYGLD